MDPRNIWATRINLRDWGIRISEDRVDHEFNYVNTKETYIEGVKKGKHCQPLIIERVNIRDQRYYIKGKG